MNWTTRRRTVGAVATVGLAAAMLGSALLPAAAGESTGKDTAGRTTAAQLVAQQRASGVMYTVAPGAKVDATLVRSAVLGVGASVAGVRLQTVDEAGVVDFVEPVSVLAARDAATRLAKVPGVTWAQPDLLLTTDSTPPVNPSDPDFRKGTLFNIWDFKDKRPSPVSGGAAITLPKGGYSSHAPSFWTKTKGKLSTVVAVIDTGRTAHPQLDAHTVAGYDMISSASNARDGNGRDANPQDQGDWGTSDSGSLIPSSWHGTHVAGIVGALQDGKTIVGNAPNVSIQHVRVLGKDGGSMSDIAAAITWASGGSVSGVTKNKTPARVLNLSLGGYAQCSDYPALQSAIDGARSRGSVVIVAAGNSNYDASYFAPANCKGVITVASLDQYGQRASYSNYGSTIEIATTGGEDPYYGPYLLIKSTVNTGKKTPVAAGYGFMMGTSQATPGVAGAAALLASTGLKGAALEKKLLKSVRGFPTYSFYTGNNCTKALCGEGILDLSKAL
ncbi:S8 family serine peptidase [Cellulomonas composti]|uniref:Peptidase S8/S53 domain-containing protein n=1 Tax=Cellulomonas composti TaxID=266130 RepID=A0A511J680_9CELL|nr:S8 family serine peptidase [Cellulomonas composti]GEL93497.1 hypothetical protein CCO02nite_01550 [Cellulomonas composti]